MVTIEQIRLQCRVDGEEEDELLEQYRFAAAETLKVYTGRNWYEAGVDIPAADPRGMHYTAAVNQAMLILIASWYAERESVSQDSGVPAAFRHLIQPYRVMGV